MPKIFNSILSCTIIILLFVLSFTTYISADNDTGYAINVKVKGINDTVMYLAYHYGDKIYVEDTFEVNKKGVCVFEGDEKLKGGIYLAVIPGKGYFEFLLDEDQHFSMETDTNNYVKNMKVKGSDDNEMFNEYQRYTIDLQAKMKKISERMQLTEVEDSLSVLEKKMDNHGKELNVFRQKMKKKYKGTFLAKIIQTMEEPEVPEFSAATGYNGDTANFKYHYFKEHFWDNIDFSDNRLARTPLIYHKIKQYLEKLTLRHPDSIIVSADQILDKATADKDIFKFALTYITYQYETSKIMGMDKVFVHLAKNYYLNGKADWMKEKQLKKVKERVMRLENNLIGNVAPDLKLLDKDHKQVSLYDKAGDMTILFFWDYTCGHCKKSMPDYLDVYKKYKEQGLSFFAVCTKIEKQKWLDYIEENKLDWINVYDPYDKSKFRLLYDIHSTPTVYLLDKNKQIVAKRVGAKQLDEIIERFIKKGNN